MIRRRQKNEALLHSPTLRLDSQSAWRQGEDAVFLPIVYEHPRIKPARQDEQIIPLAQPTALLEPVEALSWEEKRKNLASLKRKAEAGDFRAPKSAQKNQAEVDPSFVAPVDPPPPKSKHLSRSVPLLLLAVIALVLFAWMTFR